MEIIDTLVPIASKNAYFTVDLSAVNKRVSVISSPANGFLMNSSRRTKFVKNDNLVLLSGGYYIPEGFTTTVKAVTSDTYPLFPEFQLIVRGETSGGGALPGLGELGSFIVPFENYEVSLNIFSDINGMALGQNYKLEAYLTFNDIQISMVNVPTFLDGYTFHVYPFLKVLHNFAMIP
jgi:hypothetical protein